MSPAAPVISVVLPFHDEETHLRGAIESVRAQEVGVEWELILVDDGSSDASHHIAAREADRDERIRLLRHRSGTNEGIAASRNLGLDRARGRFVCPLDADDRWEPDKLARQLRLLEGRPEVVLACGPARYLHQSDGTTEVRQVTPSAPTTMAGTTFARRVLCGGINPPTPSAVMFRADAMRSAGGVPSGPDLNEDRRTWVALCLRGRVAIDDRVTVHYTVRGDSVYGRLRGDPVARRTLRRAMYRWAAPYLARRGWRGWVVLLTAGLRLGTNRLRTTPRRIRTRFGRPATYDGHRLHSSGSSSHG